MAHVQGGKRKRCRGAPSGCRGSIVGLLLREGLVEEGEYFAVAVRLWKGRGGKRRRQATGFHAPASISISAKFSGQI